MDITTSYDARILSVIEGKDNKPTMRKDILEETAGLCREILVFCMLRICESWDDISKCKGKDRKNFTDHLFHSTETNMAKYPEFDAKYPKLPSYTRRCIVAHALGKVSSWKSNYQNWLDNGKQGNPPKLGMDERYQPTFYKEDRDVEGDGNTIRLRMFVNGDWSFVTVVLKPSDMRYIRKLMKTRRMLSPSIKKKRGKYYVSFSFEEKVDLVDKQPLDYTILAVDLGINNAATMCVMQSDGTILGRKIFSLPCEKDRLLHTLNKVKSAQEKGYTDRRVWRKVHYINEDISRKTAAAIMDMAVLYSVDCIVFEHLDTSGKKKGGKKQMLHHWKCQEVQKIVELRAHRLGMRISRICAWNTSRLAYDGSGQVSRGEYYIKHKKYYNYSICVFQNGKQYHCDLNAAYNIGARYFLRAYQNAYGDIEISTPQRTLSTLWEYVGNLQQKAA